MSLLGPWERLRSIVMSMSVCVSVCLFVFLSVREDISGTTRAIFTMFCAYCLVHGSVLMLTIGRIAYGLEGGDGSAQRGRSAIYDCLVCVFGEY